MTKKAIEIHDDRCVGCLTCQLRCSFLKTGEFNPLASMLVIDRLVNGDRTITFTSECDECGVCAHFCAYGALKLMEEKRESHV